MHPRRHEAARPRLRAAWLVALALSLAASSAAAQETEGERLFREGRARMLDARFDEACPMLAESQRLEPHVGTLLNLAACHERQGKVGSAWVEYQKALTAARAEGQAERAQLAEQRIKVLEPRVPWLRVTSAVDDATLSLDGGELARAAWDQDMPVDPGLHVVVAERGGAKVFEETVDVRESERRTVRVTPPPLPAAPPPDPDKVGPERVVIEPQSAKSEPAPASPAKGRWVLEPGVFVGYLGGSLDHPRLSSPENVPLSPVGGGDRESCGGRSCSVSGFSGGGTAAFGLQLFAGYAFSDAFQLALRIIAAPATAGGGAWGFGPAVRLRATDAVSVGLFGLFGDASLEGNAQVAPVTGYRVEVSNPPVEGTLAGGLGAGVELSVKLLDLGRGSVLAQTTPFFLGGNGSAFCVPVGVAYHFQ
jgi:hypothetical protein